MNKIIATATALAVLSLGGLAPSAGAGAPLVIEDIEGDGNSVQGVLLPANEPVLDISQTTISSDAEFFTVETVMGAIGDPMIPPAGSLGYYVTLKALLGDTPIRILAGRLPGQADEFSMGTLDATGVQIPVGCVCEGEFNSDTNTIVVRVPIENFQNFFGEHPLTPDVEPGVTITDIEMVSIRFVGQNMVGGLLLDSDTASEEGAVFTF